MSDRIISVEPRGGHYGLGFIVAEKDLSPEDWYFPCHFKDDPVLAGSLMAEGCVQLLQFFLLYLGLQTLVEDATFQPIHDLSQIVRCRGQVIPGDTKITYHLEVKEIGLKPSPYAIADIDILLDEKIVGYVPVVIFERLTHALNVQVCLLPLLDGVLNKYELSSSLNLKLF